MRETCLRYLNGKHLINVFSVVIVFNVVNCLNFQIVNDEVSLGQRRPFVNYDNFKEFDNVSDIENTNNDTQCEIRSGKYKVIVSDMWHLVKRILLNNYTTYSDRSRQHLNSSMSLLQSIENLATALSRNAVFTDSISMLFDKHKVNYYTFQYNINNHNAFKIDKNKEPVKYENDLDSNNSFNYRTEHKYSGPESNFSCQNTLVKDKLEANEFDVKSEADILKIPLRSGFYPEILTEQKPNLKRLNKSEIIFSDFIRIMKYIFGQKYKTTNGWTTRRRKTVTVGRHKTYYENLNLFLIEKLWRARANSTYKYLSSNQNEKLILRENLKKTFFENARSVGEKLYFKWNDLLSFKYDDVEKKYESDSSKTRCRKRRSLPKSRRYKNEIGYLKMVLHHMNKAIKDMRYKINILKYSYSQCLEFAYKNLRKFQEKRNKIYKGYFDEESERIKKLDEKEEILYSKIRKAGENYEKNLTQTPLEPVNFNKENTEILFNELVDSMITFYKETRHLMRIHVRKLFVRQELRPLNKTKKPKDFFPAYESSSYRPAYRPPFELK